MQDIRVAYARYFIKKADLDGWTIVCSNAKFRVLVEKSINIIIEEVPSRRGQKNFRQYYYLTWHAEVNRKLVYSPESLLGAVGYLKHCSSYSDAVVTLEMAIDAAAKKVCAEYGSDISDRDRESLFEKGRETRQPVVLFVPEDAQEIIAKGRDFTLKSTWTFFWAQDPNPHPKGWRPYQIICKNHAEANKLHRILSVDPSLLQSMQSLTYKELPSFLSKLGVKYYDESVVPPGW